MNKAIIIGIDHHNTLSLLRVLGRKEYEIIVILYGCHGCSYVASSKYCDRVITVCNASEAVSILKNVLEELKEKPIVLTGADQISSLMDLEFDYFEDKCYCFNAGEKGRVTKFMDKQTQTKLASENGFVTPFSMIINSRNIDYDNIPFPCILKPNESIHGGKDISVCLKKSELVNSLDSFSSGNRVLLQEFITKEKELVVLGYSIKEHVVVSGFVEKHRDYKGATTYSTTHSIVELPNKLILSCISMIKAINYTGLWGIELIKDKDNFYFIELNLRNDATSYSIVCAGYDFVNEYCNTLLNNSFKNIKQIEVRSINSMVEYEDFNFVLKREVSLHKWRKQKKQCECLYFYDNIDSKPNIIKRKQYLFFLLKRLFH